MPFAASKTSTAQTSINAGAVIVSALINSGAFKPNPDDIAGSVLGLLAEVSTPIEDKLSALVEEDLKSAAAPRRQATGGDGYVSHNPGTFKPKDPGAEKLTKPKSEGGTSEVGGMTVREIWLSPHVGRGTGRDYINRLADGKFGTVGMQAKARAFLATLSASEAAGVESPEPTYLG